MRLLRQHDLWRMQQSYLSSTTELRQWRDTACNLLRQWLFQLSRLRADQLYQRRDQFPELHRLHSSACFQRFILRCLRLRRMCDRPLRQRRQ